MRKPEEIIPIILAAGSSPNLPFPKALAPFGNQTALEIAVNNCSFLGRCMVVLGSNADEILPHVPPSAQVIVNKQWRNGQLSSLQVALRRISTDAAFLIYPVDHPLLPGKTFQQLVRAFRARRPSQEIVMPRYRGTDGHPVIVSPALRPEFFKARTAREVIYRIPERIHPVEVKTTAILQDFNSPETYLSCRRKWRNVRSR